MDPIKELAVAVIEWSALTLIFVIGIGILYITALYVIDKNQTQQTIRRNYPVVGRFRYFFEHLGEFFRQYFFAMDREELPFNRAERSWVYRAAKKVDTTIAFGSTRSLETEGEPIFVNCPFPTLDQDALESRPITIGTESSRNPYTTAALVNISGMSYGAISKPAILSLSQGAKAAGIWMNTGEGGLSPYHLEGGCDIVFHLHFVCRDKILPHLVVSPCTILGKANTKVGTNKLTIFKLEFVARNSVGIVNSEVLSPVIAHFRLV